MVWFIESARKVIAVEYKPKQPQCVQQAIAAYREVNSWFQSFPDEKCEVDTELKEGSGALHIAYRNFCFDTHEYVCSTMDFYAALENAGVWRQKPNTGKVGRGLKRKEFVIAMGEGKLIDQYTQSDCHRKTLLLKMIKRLLRFSGFLCLKRR